MWIRKKWIYERRAGSRPSGKFSKIGGTRGAPRAFACGIKEMISFRGETSFVMRADGELIRPSMLRGRNIRDV